MTPAHVLAQTKTQLAKILRSPGCRSVPPPLPSSLVYSCSPAIADSPVFSPPRRRTPVFVDDERDVLELSQAFVADRLCPIFLLSNVTGPPALSFFFGPRRSDR